MAHGGHRGVGPRVRHVVHAPRHAGLSPRTIALRDAQAAEKPVLAAMGQQQSQYDAQQAQREKNAEGFAQALAHMLGGIGPEVQSDYSNAAGSTAAFSKGFADAETHRAANEDADLGSFLSKAGISGAAASQALGKVGGGSDVLYGLTGYEPAKGFAREGAAFTAAADQLPSMAAGQGQQTLRSLENDRQKQDQSFEQQIAAERSKIPTLAQSILQDMLNREQQQESIDIQQGYLGNSTRGAQENATGVDPVTGQAKPGYYIDKGGRVLPDGYTYRRGHVVRISTAHSSSSYDFNQAMSSNQTKIYGAAKDLVTTTKSNDPLAGLPGHPATVVHKPPYAKAAKTLFNEYKYLLRQVPRKQQASAKRYLTQVIREALGSVGIHQSNHKSRVPKTSGPGHNY